MSVFVLRFFVVLLAVVVFFLCVCISAHTCSSKFDKLWMFRRPLITAIISISRLRKDGRLAEQ